MATKIKKAASRFLQAAQALDAEFLTFDRLADELERVSISSETGIDRGRAILGELGECRQRFEPATQELAMALEEARARTAAAAGLVEVREKAVVERVAAANQLFARYKTLGDMVQRVNDMIKGIRSTSGALTEAERSVLAERQPELDSQLGTLVEQARHLMDDARAENIATLVRSADSLRQSIQTARHRFSQLAGQPGVRH